MIKVSTTIDFSRFEQKMQKSVDAVIAGVEQGVDEATKGAIREGRRLMELRGTYGSKKRFAGLYGKFAGPGISDGRIDTGEMFYSLDREVRVGRNGVKGVVGWIDNFEEYFLYQEEGFEYVNNDYPISGPRGSIDNPAPPSHNVEGMFIFRDMQTLLDKTAPGLSGAAISRRLKGID